MDAGSTPTKAFLRVSLTLNSKECICIQCGQDISNPDRRRKLFNGSRKTCDNLASWFINIGISFVSSKKPACLTQSAVLVPTKIQLLNRRQKFQDLHSRRRKGLSQNIKLFPDPVGEQKNTSFPLRWASITCCCPALIDSPNQNLSFLGYSYRKQSRTTTLRQRYSSFTMAAVRSLRTH